METGGGNVPLPNGQDVIFPRLAPDGVRFAGIGNADDLCWLWDGVAWSSHGLAFGPRAVIFDQAGNLQVIRPPGPAVGYRYVEEGGRLVTANETLFDLRRYVWEFTTLGGITIGQGGEGPDGEDPCIALFPDGRRKLIQAGRCRFINVTWYGNLYAIGLVREDVRAAQFYWLTRTQIEALPTQTAVQPPDPPQPEPHPEPSMKLPDNVYATLVSLRPKYPTPLGDQGAALLNEVAWAHRAEGYGLESKDGGNTCPQPQTGKRCGCDILRTQTLGWDVLADAEGEGRPVQADSGVADPARFVAPVNPGTAPEPEPKPQPQPEEPGAPGPTELGKRVTALEAKVAALTIRLDTQQGEVEYEVRIPIVRKQ
jgi:hypothetical protein